MLKNTVKIMHELYYSRHRAIVMLGIGLQPRNNDEHTDTRDKFLP